MSATVIAIVIATHLATFVAGYVKGRKDEADFHKRLDRR